MDGRRPAEEAELECGPSGQMPRPIGNSELALHYAAAKGCVECVQSLLLVDAHESANNSQVVRGASSKLSSCSSAAAAAATSTTHDKAAKPKTKTAPSSEASSNLSQGFSIERVRTQRFSPNAPMAHNQVTPVYLAAQEGHLPVLRLLVEEADGQLEARASDGMSALHAAAQMGNLDCIRWMLVERQLEPNLLDKEGATALHYAASRGHVHCIKWILRHSSAKLAPDFNGLTPLDDAAENGQLEALKALVFYTTRTSTSTGIPVCHLAPHFNRKKLRPSNLSRLVRLCLMNMRHQQDPCHLLTAHNRAQFVPHQQLPIGARPMQPINRFAYRPEQAHQIVQLDRQQAVILNQKHRKQSNLQLRAVDRQAPSQPGQANSARQAKSQNHLLLKRQHQLQQQLQIKQILEQQRLAKQAAMFEEEEQEQVPCCCGQAGCCPPPLSHPNAATSLIEQRKQANMAKCRKRQAALKRARMQQQQESLRAQLDSTGLPLGPVPLAFGGTSKASIVVESAPPREGSHQLDTKPMEHNSTTNKGHFRPRLVSKKLHRTVAKSNLALKEAQGHLYSVPNVEADEIEPPQQQTNTRFKFNSPALSMRSSKLITRLSIQAINLAPPQLPAEPPDQTQSSPVEQEIDEKQAVNLLDDTDQSNGTRDSDEPLELEMEMEEDKEGEEEEKTRETDHDEASEQDTVGTRQEESNESERGGAAASASKPADGINTDRVVSAPSQHHEHKLTAGDEDLTRHIPVRQSCRIVRRSARAPIKQMLDEDESKVEKHEQRDEAPNNSKLDHNEPLAQIKRPTQANSFYGTMKSLSDARLFDRQFDQPDSSSGSSVSASNESLERQSGFEKEVGPTIERSKKVTSELDQICAMFAGLPSQELDDWEEQIGHTDRDDAGAQITGGGGQHFEPLRELDEAARQRSLSELGERQHSLALATVRGCVQGRQLVTRSESDPRLLATADMPFNRLAGELDSAWKESARWIKSKSYISSTSYSGKMFHRHQLEKPELEDDYQERRATTVVRRRSLFGTLVDRVRRVGSADCTATTRPSQQTDRASPMSLFDLQNLDANSEAKHENSDTGSRRASGGSSLKAKAAALSRRSSGAKAPSCPPPPPPPPPPPMPASHFIGRSPPQHRPLMSTFKQQLGAELREQKLPVQRRQSSGLLSNHSGGDKQKESESTQARLAQHPNGHSLADSDGSSNSYGDSPGAHSYAASSRVARSDCSADSGCCGALDSMGTTSNSSESPVDSHSSQTGSDHQRALQLDCAKRSDSAGGAFQPPKFLSPPEDGANIKPSEYLNRMRAAGGFKTRPTSKPKPPTGPICMQKSSFAPTNKTVIKPEPAELEQVVTIPLIERLQVYQSNCKAGVSAQQAACADQQTVVGERRVSLASASQPSGSTTLPHRRVPSNEQLETSNQVAPRAANSSTLGRQRAANQSGLLPVPPASSQLEATEASWRTTATTQADDVDFEKIAAANLSQECHRDGSASGKHNQQTAEASRSIRRAPVLTSNTHLMEHSRAGLSGGTSASKQILTTDNDDGADGEDTAAAVASADDRSWAQRRVPDQPEGQADEQTTSERVRHFLDRVARFDANGCEIPNWKRFMLAKRLAGRRNALGNYEEANDAPEANRGGELDGAHEHNNETTIAGPQGVVKRRASDQRATAADSDSGSGLDSGSDSDKPPAWRRQLRPTGQRLALASD